MRALIADAPAPAGDDRWPDVDVVMPIRNEVEHLPAALAAVTRQEYPGTVRIFLAVGPSQDGTERLARDMAAERDELTTIDNPAGTTPAALNLAIAAGSAPVIVRVDGHSQLSGGYIQSAVEIMRRTGAVNVGGLQLPVPSTPFERAVAAATASWLGTGGATYRVGGDARSVDTVYLGVFDRNAVETVGGFDERLIRNQDYELNIRLRDRGGTVWFDPRLTVGYRPRGSWRGLAKQYYEYGYWKAAVLTMHPKSARARQVLPVAALSLVAAGLVITPRWRVGLAAPFTYALALGVASTSHQRPTRVAGVLGVMHASWSMGLVRGALARHPSWRT